MRKYFLPLIILLLGLTLIVPMTVSAANDVVFSESTNLYLEGIPLTLVVSAGSQVEAFTVYPTYVSLDLCEGSSIIITSAARKNLIANPPVASTVCGTTSSSITIGATFTRTVTVTPGDSCVSPEEVGGSPVVSGGGAAAPAAPAVPAPTMPTTTTGEVTATATAGGKTTVTTAEDTQATVRLPAYAVSASTDVAAVPVATTATAVATATAAVPTGQNLVGGYVYDFTATSAGVAVTTFSKTVTITMTYTTAQIVGLKESSLTVNRWDEAESEWVSLETTVNRVTNTLTATTLHFTYFAIMGEVGVEEEKPIAEMTIAELKAKIVEILAQVAVLQAELAKLIGVEALNVDLSYDDSGDDVELLQTWLAKDSEVYPEGLVTGWFGPLTKAAVIKFQEKYADEVLTPWGITEGTGFVGSTTREKLNALYGGE